VVIDCHRELFLGGFLADYVLIQELLDFQGFGKLVRIARRSLGAVVL